MGMRLTNEKSIVFHSNCAGWTKRVTWLLLKREAMKAEVAGRMGRNPSSKLTGESRQRKTEMAPWTRTGAFLAFLLLLISITLYIYNADIGPRRFSLFFFHSTAHPRYTALGPFRHRARHRIWKLPSSPSSVHVRSPRRFNFAMLDHRSDTEPLPASGKDLPPWPSGSGIKKQHSMEYWMTASLLIGEDEAGDDEMEAVRVRDAEKADAFFVPFFSSLSFNTHGHNMTDPDTEIDRQLQADLLGILRKSQYWQRSAGRDHVFPMQHPNAFRFHRGQLNASILVVADFGRYPKTLSRLNKDIVTPYVHVVQSLMDDDPPNPFRITPPHFCSSVEELSEKMKELCAKGLLSAVFLTAVHARHAVAGFCLHPAGDTPSSCRLFDAIVSHCVPVIVSDHIELPFESELDYSDFSLFFSVGEALKPGYMVSQLRAVSKDKWLQLWKKLKCAANFRPRGFGAPESTAEDTRLVEIVT
ncbi:hypothetical protein HPP92_001422 [Vanilla planifolia]|uniref:Exostosin GT47 domain-containing protein n=1 Tax=Vanilla planifolia TaxID=51239 RepID=A0A835RR19_VANPL|nr:hypothetical protein HPP92_001422 [Vanilla planifolia]